MPVNRQEKKILVVGELKGGEKFWSENGELIIKTTSNGAKYLSALLTIDFDKTDRRYHSKIKDSFISSSNNERRKDNLLIFFWDSFLKNLENKKILSSLKPNTLVEVYGELKRDGGNLLSVFNIKKISNSKETNYNEDNDFDSDDEELFI